MNSGLDPTNFDQIISERNPQSVVQTWESHIKKNNRDVIQGHRFSSYPRPLSPFSPSCSIIPHYLEDQIEMNRENGNLGAPESPRPFSESHLVHDKIFLEQSDSELSNVEEQSCIPFWNSFLHGKHIVHNIYDSCHSKELPGILVTSVEENPCIFKTCQQRRTISDPSVAQAIQKASEVFRFYKDNYQHNSIDGQGGDVTSTVHFGNNYENALWKKGQMVYGDGSSLFNSFVSFLDVVGHEFTHGVTGSRLAYQGESGAINEHFSDVMGYLIYMYTNRLTTEQADWLFAKGILSYNGKTYPLRSFKEPGTAYDIPAFGKDPQPAKYSDLYKGSGDNGGVHINSGIPNHAFYLFAEALGGKPWEKAGLIWFTTMKEGTFSSHASMKDFAKATITTAKTLFAEEPGVYNALIAAWRDVEVID